MVNVKLNCISFCRVHIMHSRLINQSIFRLQNENENERSISKNVCVLCANMKYLYTDHSSPYILYFLESEILVTCAVLCFFTFIMFVHVCTCLHCTGHPLVSQPSSAMSARCLSESDAYRQPLMMTDLNTGEMAVPLSPHTQVTDKL